jgi:streptomycin 6-kinase
MNANEFVDAVRSVVRDAATEDVMSLLERPPGRRPSAELVALSQWFNGLDDAAKQRVREVAAVASHHATFGMLAVIDGVRVIEDEGDRGAVELRYVKGSEFTVLNDPASRPLLHDLL